MGDPRAAGLALPSTPARSGGGNSIDETEAEL
jgi:hypothetical protein